MDESGGAGSQQRAISVQPGALTPLSNQKCTAAVNHISGWWWPLTPALWPFIKASLAPPPPLRRVLYSPQTLAIDFIDWEPAIYSGVLGISSSVFPRSSLSLHLFHIFFSVSPLAWLLRWSEAGRRRKWPRWSAVTCFSQRWRSLYHFLFCFFGCMKADGCFQREKARLVNVYNLF